MWLTTLDLTAGGLALAGAAVFLGGYARGYSGFGSAAIMMAVLTLILPPHEVVPIAIALEIAAGIVQLPGVRRAIDWRLLAVILAGALIGNPFGIKALLFIDPDPLRIAILSFILLVSLTLLSGKTFTGGRWMPVAFLAGLFSGFVNGAAALAGLPIALFLAARNAQAATMRATLAVYISLIGVYTAALLANDGFYTGTTFWRIGMLLPVLALGLWLGGRRFGATSPASFRRFTLVLLIALAGIGLTRVALVG